MTYDYLSINFPAVAGIIFLLIFLLTNNTLDPRIKKIFHFLILIESVEIITYSLELWTTTFPVLSPLRLWLSAVGYAIRPFIFLLMLMLATRKTSLREFPVRYYIPCILNTITSFSVFFTDIVYSYTPDNLFVRGPLGYFTYITVILYLAILTIAVIRSYGGRPHLEILVIFAICLFFLCSMAIEALFSIRTVGRTTIVMSTIFYYMFFQSRLFKATLSEEQSIRQKLEHDSRLDTSTGVLTKTAFTNAANTLLDAPEKALESIGFLFIDMDHLKKVNDTMGHAAGDIAISEAASAIQTTFRRPDLIGRFGGDEFYVLVPDIPRDRFVVCLNEIQSRLQREYSAGDVSVSVSASIGAVYASTPDGLHFKQLVQLADEALYDAKAAGRNCHCLREI